MHGILTAEAAMTTKRVALYARTSTADKQDPETQLLDLRRYALARGWEVVGEYVDQISGAKERRPGLDALMECARHRQCDVVLVWRFDRFGRSTSHLLRGLEEFRSLGVDFVSFSEAIDTGSSVGTLIFSILAALAAFERQLVTERVRAGLRRARAQGKPLGRRKVRDDARIKRLRSEGLSIRQIAKAIGLSTTAVQRGLKSGV
jgi:DNA invertase Pin-like site-specific DNA recombinase